MVTGAPSQSLPLPLRMEEEGWVWRESFNSALSYLSLTSSLVEVFTAPPAQAPEALSAHPWQPLLVNNNSSFKNSSINLFALLLAVPGFYPQKTRKRCVTCFLQSCSPQSCFPVWEKTGMSLANTHNVIARQFGSTTVKYSSWQHGRFISQYSIATCFIEL